MNQTNETGAMDRGSILDPGPLTFDPRPLTMMILNDDDGNDDDDI